MMEEEQFLSKGVGYREYVGRKSMYVFNALFFLAGAVVFSVSVFIHFDSHFVNIIGNLEYQEFYDSATILMIASVLLMVNACVAIMAVYLWNFKLVLLYTVLAVLSFTLNLTGAVYFLMHGLDATYTYNFTKEKMYALMSRYQYDVPARRAVDTVQEYGLCCGATGSSDWDDLHLPMPNTCRDQVTGNQFGDSCANAVASTLEFYTGLASGVILCVCLLQLMTFLFVCFMYQAIKEKREKNI